MTPKMAQFASLASWQFVISINAPIGELCFCFTRQIYVKLARPILPIFS